MNSEKKKIAPPRGELKDEELEEISGGMVKLSRTTCRCPNCNNTVQTVEGSECPLCMVKGIRSPMVKVSTL